ncbi:hypothetical protein RHSIM_Rhsim09G0163900 [Rhododendron simsii]|uniref:SOSEKI DIX-like domain-containing protein n=1 Tax=Rhododendron simsii TaxID=118357 RepID=A0A834GIV1_RHOSS|nr:hypothetical protein RHSIM_Rhsim09G0163900 [Rhododendron simsii]
MAMNSRTSTEYLIPKKWQEMEIISPEKPKISTENNLRINNKSLVSVSVSVLYYISRNGHLDHPHFMEVPLSSSRGLYLRDVINRLNFLRGKGMASMYSWSSKRSYRNGFVWHDLSENDLIHPTHGTAEYVLKGSELLRTSSSFRYPENTRTSETVPEAKLSGENRSLPATIRRRNRSWSSFDESQEYRVYSGELAAGKSSAAADASTQTGDDRRLRTGGEECGETTMELSRGSSSISSSEVILGGVMSGSRAVDVSGEIGDRTDSREHHSARMKASRVLMQLVSCGSVSVKTRGL